MTMSPEFKKRLRQAIGPTVGACLFGYFTYHAIEGDRGIMAWLRISQQLAESKSALATLVGERQEIEHRVALLSPASIDPDLLDERARLMLNVAEPDDRLVIIKNPKSLN
ncbi:MAG TPA: septum formation initiator family protein [Candidatus Angelobacter sp.]|nr:septum formation initiator family protein [Candidatus Angelobacter sp.]